jgi:uncharacterized protein (TIGR02996 family)
MSDEQAFLHSLLANPSDDTLRLVFADWLNEHGDPRGTFLRVEVAFHQAGEAARADLRERLHQARRGLDARWLALVDRPQPGWRIVRSGEHTKVHGRAIPAFIHNFSYHYAPVEVCGDGAINCWAFVDVPLFRGKLAQGWVVPRAQVGGTLSIHNLGQARVEAAEWDRTQVDIEQEVLDAIREMNPAMDGLLDMGGTDVEERNGLRYAKGAGLGQAKPYRVTVSGDEVIGDELPVLEVATDGLRLRPWLIYADGLTQVGSATELLPIEAVGRMFEEGRLTLSVPAGTWVTLDGLGRFQAGEGYWWIEPRERLREASDLLDQLNGGPGARHLCIEAHRAYEAAPSDEKRQALRRAYEAVPEHLRMYCGDMDSKDGPIRRILGEFGDEGKGDE